MCVGSSRDWYGFDGNIWVKDNRARCIWKRLRDDLPRIYAAAAAEQQRRVALAADDRQRAALVRIVERMNDIVLRLGNERFKKSLVEECAYFLSAPKFVDTLDTKDHPLGFDNGVYDLDEGVFRAGTPDDSVSLSCGYDFAFYDDEEVHADIRRSVDSTQATPDMARYLWLTLAYMLHGRKYLELLWFWTGGGRNGKGMVTALVDKAFGDYFYAPDPLIFVTSDKNPSSARPEIAHPSRTPYGRYWLHGELSAHEEITRISGDSH